MLRVGFLALMLALSACAAGDDGCGDIQDEAQRQLCRMQKVRTESGARDETGIGPPSCHPGSTNPDRSRDRC